MAKNYTIHRKLYTCENNMMCSKTYVCENKFLYSYMVLRLFCGLFPALKVTSIKSEEVMVKSDD
jgi:hypothetical protein